VQPPRNAENTLGAFRRIGGFERDIISACVPSRSQDFNRGPQGPEIWLLPNGQHTTTMLAAEAVPWAASGVTPAVAIHSTDEETHMTTSDESAGKGKPPETALATVGGGCFWCTEAVFLKVRGIKKVVSGYTGGSKKNPTYKEVCTGLTGHAEVIQLEFDPSVITFEQILDVFFYTHDPTTKNRQGADVGTQYRSAVFYHDQSQKEAAEKMIAELNKSGDFDNPIVTTIEKMEIFYPAEDYHQNYFELNPSNPYCMAVVGPKVSKFRKRYKALLKKDGEE
jgi:peptide-methionine (S)-S-oxide reductase